MKRFVQVGLLLLAGLGLLRTSLFTDEYLRFVKEGMRPLLVVSGVLLIGLAAAEAWPGRRPAGHDDGHGSGRGGDDDGHGPGDGGHGEGDDRGPGEGCGPAVPGARGRGHGDDHGPAAAGHGHDHSRVPRVAWLLFLPVLSLLFYAPPALGSYTASREPAKVVAVQEDDFDPLPAASPLPITLTEFTQRVQQDRSRAISGRTVRMTGFVTSAEGGGWYLTRIVISCCAADSTTLKVRVYGTAAPKADTWVTVDGTWHPGGTLGTSSAGVALDARGVTRVEKPSNAYMDAVPLVG
ncbi:TIGR03943 family putative permease subunit [Streptomyces hilarionis]|uniref:TIGR03943 family putative permease subunit n=1 Tax=Streptomyces hilarionis TaxID=2839954 RepID=UPI00211A98BC|nr:TIGR03943 family protein [Streptomyces hilarionis]MCQ9129891.1 TIGR03943 family protein [Streptomyces hilarionis]